MPTIQSVRNELIKELKTLATAKGREEQGLFLVEGEKLAKDALSARWPLMHCLYLPGRLDRLASLAKEAGAQTIEVSQAVLQALCTTKTPQGIALTARMPCGVSMEGLASPLLALDGVQDPGNVGTLLRTAEASGFGGALLGPGCADPYAPKVMRGSMGSLFRLPVFSVDDLPQHLGRLRAEGWSCAATAMDAEDFFARGDMPQKRVLVIGSEGRGVGEGVLAACDRRFTLKMAGGTQSLNAAVAAGIMMYDWFREQPSRS